jgi:hypothetical protein
MNQREFKRPNLRAGLLAGACVLGLGTAYAESRPWAMPSMFWSRPRLNGPLPL